MDNINHDISTSASVPSSSLRQPEFHDATSSFSTAEQLLNKLDTYEASNIFNDTDTRLVQEIPEGIGDETEEARLRTESRLNSVGGSGGQTQSESGQSSSHWISSGAGNPVPLRQPNLAAVPPEVLGALLKNENYGTFDGALVESVTERNNPSSSAEHKPRQSMDPKEKDHAGGNAVDGARTKTSDSPGVNPNNVLPPKYNVATKPIIFSPHAKEFVPRGFSAGANVGSLTSKVSSLSLKTATYPSPNNYNSVEELKGYPVNPDYPYQTEYDFENLPPEVKNGFLLDVVSEAISQLKQTPADFDYVIKETIEMLHSYLNDADTLQTIATMIITESIAHMNFTYLGARMCGELVKGGVEVKGKKFLHILLNNCSERFAVIVTEFKNRNGNSAAALPSDVHGFTRFFGELFMNLKVEKNGVFENYTVIGLAVVELLDSLAKTRSSENVKFVAQVLKLVGWQLEHNSDPQGKIKEYMNNIFNELEQEKTSKTVAPTSVAIIENLEKLRQRDWDYMPEEPHAAAGGVTTSSIPQVDTYPIYELPDEFDEDWDEDYDENGIFLDDEPDDVQAAYDEFLWEQEQKSKS